MGVLDDTTRVLEIKTKYDFIYNDTIMIDALNYSRKRLLETIFLPDEIKSTTVKEYYELKQYIADVNFDKLIDIDDINITTYMSEPPFTVNNVPVTNIQSFLPGHPNGKSYLTFKPEFVIPSNHTLSIQYKYMIEDFSKLDLLVKEIEELYVIIYLFRTLSPFKLQQGMTTKQINGIDIVFDKQSVDEYINETEDDISIKSINIKGVDVMDVNINHDYSNGGHNGIIRRR